MTRDRFFKSMATLGLALTYDDVRLRTGPSTVPAHEVALGSRFSRHVPLKRPIISAAMDTVTTSDMAIAMAMSGGLGVIHAALPPADQAREVKRVKFFLNGQVEKPITVRDDDMLQEVQRMRREMGFKFHSFPVVDRRQRLVGLLTKNDFLRCRDHSQTVRSVMTPDVMSAPPDTDLDQAYRIMMKNKQVTVLPLVDDSQHVTGLYLLSDVIRVKHGSSSLHNVDDANRLRVAAAVGTDQEALERVELMHRRLDAVVVDTARGDSRYAFDTLKAIKQKYPDLDVVVGNISEGASARLLAKAGADGIKVGQGPGSICTTRVETGIGCPQVTAVYECAKAVADLDVPVCADGGVSNRGDIPIAIGAGASSVMLGNMLAGTKEAPGAVYMDEAGSMVKDYRGMGSNAAMRDSHTARRRYGGQDGQPVITEGIEGTVPYQGAVDEVMTQYAIALARSLEYCGRASVEEHRQKARFYRITGAGYRESRPHDVATPGRQSLRGPSAA
ncbi:IMP dehydrogenase [Candidatus Parcubacteria bacterium]|nr:IMP dehydrogenase [Candidatus Parcubacteria bacterium]